MTYGRKFIQAAAVLSATLLASMGAAGQPYPSKAIHLVVAYPAGGASDALARQIGPVLTDKLGQVVIVENRAGGATVIAAQAVAGSAPDGYTIAIFDPTTVAMNPYLFKKLPYEPVKSFQPVSLLTRIPFGIMVLPGFPANNLKEFVAHVKANPGLNFASSGAGNPVHLAMEQFKDVAGLSINHVPYKGGAPAIQDLLGGHIPMIMMDIPSAMPHIKAGKIKVLALTSAKRLEQLPEVPTISESGYPGFEAGSWFGAFVPMGTPPAIVARLNSTLREGVAGGALNSWIKSMTFEPYTSTPEEFSRRIASDAGIYGKLIKQLGLTLD